jgi:chorismate mutase/prephenate dehydratase
MNTLDRHRSDLDRIDNELLELLNERLRIAREVAVHKNSGGRRLRDREREAALLARIAERAESSGLPADSVLRVFQEILNLSFYEQVATIADSGDSAARVRVGYQGVAGAYSEQAAQRILAVRRRTADPVGYRTFASVADAVVDGRVTYGVLPVENTLAGSINETYDLLKRHSLHVIGEDVLAIDHCLAAVASTPLRQIRRVYSHPQALAQCASFLNDLPGVEVQAYFDTAAAMQKIAADNDPSAAAVGSEHAAQQYGLTILERGITDHPENYTRFLLVAAQPEEIPQGAAAKTSLVLSVRHEEGALLKALRIIHDHKINLTKLESRPKPGSPWEYFFYIDFEGNERDPDVAAMLKELRAATSDLRVLGSYISRTVAEGKPVTDTEITDARNRNT